MEILILLPSFVISLVKRGEISEVAQRLISSGVVAGTDAVEQTIWGMLHCDVAAPLYQLAMLLMVLELLRI